MGSGWKKPVATETRRNEESPVAMRGLAGKLRMPRGK